MHVLLITRYDPFSQISGTAIFTAHLSMELVKLGFRVSIICASNNKLDAYVKVHEINKYEIKLIEIPFLSAVEFCIKNIRIYEHLIKEDSPDIVLGIGAGALTGYLYWLFKFMTKRSLFVYYAIDSMISEMNGKRLLVRKRQLHTYLKFLIKYIGLIHSDRTSCQQSDIIIASSEATMNDLISYYKISRRNIYVVYLGIQDNYALNITPSLPQIPTFLHISTDPERKGTQYFIESLKLLHKKYQLSFKGIIVGSTDPLYVEMAKSTSLDINFLGRVSHEKLKLLYASCTALVAPSVSEGFCLPVIEAAMFGKPAIVTAVGSLPELVEDNVDGYIVTVANVNKLAEKLYAIAIDERVQKILSLNAKRKSKRFTISKITKEILFIINVKER